MNELSFLFSVVLGNYMKYTSRSLFLVIVAMLLTMRLSIGVAAAQHRQDSLLATFASIQDVDLRLDSMNGVAFELGFSDPGLGLELLDAAEKEAKAQGRQKALVSVKSTRGSIYYNLFIYDLAISNFSESFYLADSIGYESGRAVALNNLANIQDEQHLYKQAIESYREARSTFLKVGQKRHAMITLSNIGNSYIGLGQYDRAIEVCDSALLEVGSSNDLMAYILIYEFLGQSYLAKKDYAAALRCADLKLQKAAERKDDFGLIDGHQLRAAVNLATQQYRLAHSDLIHALELAKALEVDDELVQCYDTLAKIAHLEGDAEAAFDWMAQSRTCLDSIRSKENKTALANFQALYQVHQKDAEINLLSKDKEIQATRLLNVWYLFGLVLLGLIALAVLVVVLFRNNKARRRINLELQAKNEQILAQHEQISQQNSTLTHQNEQLNNLNHEMAGILHVVAHDLKAPLSQVTGLLLGIEEDGNLKPAQHKMLGMAKKVTHNAGNLVQDLVELGSAEQQAPLQMTPLALKDFVTEVALSFSGEAARKSITLSTSLPEHDVMCETEPNHLRRILENLISNALKFSVAGKKVGISLSQDGTGHLIRIQDQGPGISPDDKRNLYRKFRKLSARPTGGESSSGLGLAIVKTLVDQLGGEISLQSELGVGSTFTVRLPA
jgi:signal transduction histidine kinase